jgi:hypothetical protein
LPILAERGYLITAVNTPEVDYIDCAYNLIKTLKQQHPAAKVCLLTDQTDTNWPHLIDYHKTFSLPLSDNPYANDWQVFGASPFRQTVKLEADMVISSPIDHWWTMFEHRDVVISTRARDFYDQPATSRYYRKVFDANNLPDVYNAITYWRVSSTAQEFFRLVRNIFENWTEYKTLLKFTGPELVTMPFVSYPRIVHMKRHMIATHTSNWTQELVWENNPLRFNTVAQWGAVHYHVKDWRSE